MEGSLQWTNPVSLLPQRSDTPQSVPKSPNSPNRHSRSSFDASPPGPLPGATTARTTNRRRRCQPTRVTPQWQPLLAQARHGAPWSSPGRGPRTPLQFHTATPPTPTHQLWSATVVRRLPGGSHGAMQILEGGTMHAPNTR